MLKGVILSPEPLAGHSECVVPLGVIWMFVEQLLENGSGAGKVPTVRSGQSQIVRPTRVIGLSTDVLLKRLDCLVRSTCPEMGIAHVAVGIHHRWIGCQYSLETSHRG